MSNRSKVLFLILLLTVGGMIYYLVNPALSHWVPQCPFKQMTGWSCPGCGMQRSLHALLHGNLREAFLFNPYLAVLPPFLLAIFYEATFATGKTKAFIIKWLENKWTFLLFVILTFAWWIGRNIAGI